MIGSGYFRAFPCPARGDKLAPATGSNCSCRGQLVELRACSAHPSGACSAIPFEAGPSTVGTCKGCRLPPATITLDTLANAP